MCLFGLCHFFIKTTNFDHICWTLSIGITRRAKQNLVSESLLITFDAGNTPLQNRAVTVINEFVIHLKQACSINLD